MRQLRKLVAAVNGSNLALEPYRDIRSLAAGSGLSAHVSSSLPSAQVGTLCLEIAAALGRCDVSFIEITGRVSVAI